MIPSSASVNIPRHGSIQGLTSGTVGMSTSAVQDNQSSHARIYPYLHYHPHYHQHHQHQTQAAQYVHHLLSGDEADTEDPSTLLLPFEHDQQANQQQQHPHEHSDQRQQQQQQQQQHHRESTQTARYRH